MSTPTITRSGHRVSDAQTCPAAAGTDYRLDHTRDEHQRSRVEPTPTLPQAIQAPSSNLATPAGSTSDSGHLRPDAQRARAAVGADLPADQDDIGAQSGSVGGDQTSSSDHGRNDSHSETVAAAQTENGAGATNARTATTVAPSLSAPFLALAADVLDDAEKTRIANENRLRQLTRSAEDSDGEVRGFGLDESHPDVARLAALVDMLKQIEHQAGLNLQRLLRQHPLGPWVKAQKGIGEKQAARLLAVVGDPYVNEQTGEIRTVSQLWAYCGHGDPSRKLRKGMTQAELFTLGNPVAKSRTWLIATAVLKAQGPLAGAYYERKAATEGRLHATECRRCGPSGKPALEGSPWSDAHRHADALRVLGKTILRDLWREAKRIHEEGATR